jgi:segregation and condensation protein A
LLELIERKELEITTISLSEITSDYLQALELMKVKDPRELSGFLTVATRLLAIKSRHLLTEPSDIEEDDEVSLEEQLRQYQVYRTAAETLLRLREERGESFPSRHKVNIDSIFAPITRDEFDQLSLLYEQAISQTLPLPTPETLPSEMISLADKSFEIKGLLRRDHHLELGKVFGRCGSRLEIIVTFLAVLELLKQRVGRISQEKLFGAIVLEAV